MKKRNLIIAVAAAAAALLTLSQTVAWLTGSETAGNVITSGNVDIEILEETKEPAGTYEKTASGIVFKGSFMPGQTFSKIVTVKNQGINSAYVRVKIAYQDKEQNELQYSELDQPLLESSGFGTAGDSWEDGLDGYFYYNQPLESGMVTAPVLESVHIPLDWKVEQTSTFHQVVVTAEAIQSEHTGTSAKIAFNSEEKAPETVMAEAQKLVHQFLELQEKFNNAANYVEKQAYEKQAQELMNSTKSFGGMKNNDVFRERIIKEYGEEWPTVAGEGLTKILGLTEKEGQELYVNVYVSVTDGCAVMPFVSTGKSLSKNTWNAYFIYVDGKWYKPAKGKTSGIAGLNKGWATISGNWVPLNY